MVAGLLALVEFGNAILELLVVGFRQVVDRFARQLAAVDEDAALFALEENPVAEVRAIVAFDNGGSR